MRYSLCHGLSLYVTLRNITGTLTQHCSLVLCFEQKLVITSHLSFQIHVCLSVDLNLNILVEAKMCDGKVVGNYKRTCAKKRAGDNKKGSKRYARVVARNNTRGYAK